EAILRRWNKLSNWITDQREFLLWRDRFDFDRREWEAATENSKLDALLQGRPLTQAQQWLESRPGAFSSYDHIFTDLSMNRDFLIWKIKIDNRAQDWSKFNDEQTWMRSYEHHNYSMDSVRPLNKLLADNLLLKENDLTEGEHWLRKYESDFTKREREFIKFSRSGLRVSWRRLFTLIICPWMSIETLQAAEKLILVGTVCSAIMSLCYFLNSYTDLPPLYLAVLWAGL